MKLKDLKAEIDSLIELGGEDAEAIIMVTPAYTLAGDPEDQPAPDGDYWFGFTSVTNVILKPITN